MKRVITLSLLEGLRTGFRTDFQRGIENAQHRYKPITTVVNSSTGIETYGWLGEFPIMREWMGERRVKALEERAYQLRNRKFEASIGIGRVEIEDDKLGLYPNLIEGWGSEAEALKDRLVFEAVGKGHVSPCYDNQNFFDTDHPVRDGVTASNIDTTGASQPWYLLDCSKPIKPFLLQNREEANFDMIVDPKSEHVFKTDQFLAGGKARAAAGYTMWQLARRETRALTPESYQDAKLKMQSLTDAEGEPLAIRPTHLVVGISNTAAARNLFTAQLVGGGNSNILLNDVQIVEAERLP